MLPFRSPLSTRTEAAIDTFCDENDSVIDGLSLRLRVSGPGGNLMERVGPGRNTESSIVLALPWYCIATVVALYPWCDTVVLVLL